MSYLYLHIPYCRKKCHYCSFSSYVSTTDIQKKYLEALRQELRSIHAAGATELSTLFFGGGTPTCLEPTELVSLIGYCKELFGVKAGCEISVEANPGTVDALYLEKLLTAGVTRLSLGVQSFIESELTMIGRLHDRSQAIEVCTMAQKVGFTNINIDLMYGLPGQTTKSWRESLQQAFSLSPQHLSLYQLMVEEGTYFGELDEKGQLTLPKEEVILQIDALTEEICKDQGFIKYETSNFALKGYECRHNINYWENGDYWAAGAAAVSFVGGVREKRIINPIDYTKKIMGGVSPIFESECLDKDASFRETVIMGLRMTRGVDVNELQRRYDLTPLVHYGDTLEKLLNTGMVELSDSNLKISEKGWPLSNQIMAELV
ncbi:coproporphyrinogen III oxidase [Desulforhopalus sp. 52FAK]